MGRIVPLPRVVEGLNKTMGMCEASQAAGSDCGPSWSLFPPLHLHFCASSASCHPLSLQLSLPVSESGLLYTEFGTELVNPLGKANPALRH